MPAKMAAFPEKGADTTCRIRIENRALAVRNGLKHLFDDPLLRDLPPEEQGQAEIILAEILNNIVEHAYAHYPGETEVTVQRKGDSLCFDVTDNGLPLPKAALVKGDLPGIGAQHDLPEGGFGWYLIRKLATNLTYCRDAGENRLSFRIAAHDPND